MSDTPLWLIIGGSLGFIVMFYPVLKKIPRDLLEKKYKPFLRAQLTGFNDWLVAVGILIFVITYWVSALILAIYVLGGLAGILWFGWKQF